MFSKKEKIKVPKKAQDVIPVRCIWRDGIFYSEGGEFSKCFRFSDINYAIAGSDNQEAMFRDYCELLNSLDSDATTKISICNRRLNRKAFNDNVLLQMQGDSLDKYRQELNDMLSDRAGESNGIVQEKYITVSVAKKNIDEARTYFARVGAELTVKFGTLNSKCEELDASERLRIFHDFYKSGNETYYDFDLKRENGRGHSFKDAICPNTFEFKSAYFQMDGKFGRALFLKTYANYIQDDMVTDLCNVNRNLLLSIDVRPIPTDKAVKSVEKNLLGIDTDITNWQRRQNQANNFSAVIPYQMEQNRLDTKEFLDDLITRDQRMMLAVVTMVHTADTLAQLDSDTELILSMARKHLCEFAVLRYQQMDGMLTALPFGVKRIRNERTLSTESLAVLLPFCAQDIQQTDGVYYGQNPVNNKMILADRALLQNGNSMVLGVSGSGKSLIAKHEMLMRHLKNGDDVMVLDPEREYALLMQELGGEIVRIAPDSDTHINVMDMSREYGDGGNPVATKSNLLMSICEQIMGANNIDSRHRSMIDRCANYAYAEYLNSNYEYQPPTLQDFREELLRQHSDIADEIALAIELFTSGSLNTFAHQSNVDVDNRLICYDILDLGKQLQSIGMLVVLDNIFNRITRNRELGRRTFIIIDEIYLLFQHEYSANFLHMLWKRVRKYGAYCTGITQNVDDLLQSHEARTMLANSEFVIMLNQASTDRLELARLLNISEEQMKYITSAEVGSGLIKVGSAMVPFKNQYPRNNLYRLFSTKMGDDFGAGQ